jgi:hypothetical protein
MMYVNGKHIVTRSGLKLRTSSKQTVDTMLSHIYFGGSNKSWAAQKDEVRFKLSSCSLPAMQPVHVQVLLANHGRVTPANHGQVRG